MSDNLAYQEERREELIGGKVVMMSPASAGHTYVADNILMIFKQYLKGKKCIPFGDGLLVRLTEKDKFVPDVMVVCDRDKIKPDGVHGAPDLVVEVYEACGVPEYWLVGPTDKSIEVYLLESGKYILHDVYTVRPDWVLAQMTDEERAAVVTEFKCHLYDDLVIRLDDIFGDLF